MLRRHLILPPKQLYLSPVSLACTSHRLFPTQYRPYASKASKPKKDPKPKRAPNVRRAEAANNNNDDESKPVERVRRVEGKNNKVDPKSAESGKSLKEALLEGGASKSYGWDRAEKKSLQEGMKLDIKTLKAEELEFKPVDHEIPPVPMLSYGLDRVLFNPGVYRLQDPASRVYNFDPYLEKIMQVGDFDFNALSAYKTSSKDEDLLSMTKRLGSKFTGSTSSMSGILQHFHFLLSHTRKLNHDMLSRSFPKPSDNFSTITTGPSAVFLRWKNGTYAIDADKEYDSPNIMSWMGHSMEKLLTTDKDEFELYRRSNPSKAPSDADESRCFHYSSLGNFLIRSQLDAHDPRLPGSGIFDLKTRAVVSIRMDHKEYETGSGYQLRYARGEWESFEREFYDMTRATMLKYSLQVRMGRMDGIFVAYHNIERIFGFQYLSLPDLDLVLHGQSDTCLGDQEFKFSVSLLDEVLQKATEKYPEQTLRLHFHTRGERSPFMYIFAEPMTDEQADNIQLNSEIANKKYEQDVIGINRDEEELQAEWKDIQDRVDDEVHVEETEGVVDEVEEDAAEAKEAEDVVEEVDEVEEDAAEAEEAENVVQEVEEVEEVKEDAVKVEKAEGIVDEVEQDATGVEQSEIDNFEATTEGEETESNEPASESEETEGDVEQDAVGESSEATQEFAERPALTSRGPLIGWTLAIRNRVNGHYIERPENLKPEDDWTLEYHLKEIPQQSCWPLYDKVTERRKALFGEQKEADIHRLAEYRSIIQRYSNRGRKWREEQDAIDEKIGQRVYERMGPGSPSHEASKK